MLFLYNRILNNNDKCIVISPLPELRKEIKNTIIQMIENENVSLKSTRIFEEYTIIHCIESKQIIISDKYEQIVMDYKEAKRFASIIA